MTAPENRTDAKLGKEVQRLRTQRDEAMKHGAHLAGLVGVIRDLVNDAPRREVIERRHAACDGPEAPIRERVTCAVGAALPGRGGNYQIDRVVDAVLGALPRSNAVRPSRTSVIGALRMAMYGEESLAAANAAVDELIARGWLTVRDDYGGQE